MADRRQYKERWEVWASGIDEALQGVGADPFGSINQTGLRVPTLPTSDPLKRYLCLLDSFEIAEGQIKYIVGYRQAATLLGFQTTSPSGAPRFVEQEITSPFWHFPDGNISWHLRYISPKLLDKIRVSIQPLPLVGPGAPVENFAFRMSNTPAVLYDSPGTTLALGAFYFNLTAYTPPRKGRPYGEPVGHLGTFHDLRTPWRTDGAWRHSLTIPCAQPGTYAFFASVKQTDPNPQTGRLVLTPPAGGFDFGLPPEEQFLLNFPNAVYGKIVGSMIVRELPVK